MQSNRYRSPLASRPIVAGCPFPQHDCCNFSALSLNCAERVPIPSPRRPLRLNVRRHLTACLTSYSHLYLLDFINEDGARVEEATNVGVYDAGDFGGENCFEMMPPRRLGVEIYALNPGRVCRVRLRDSGALVKTISTLIVSLQCNDGGAEFQASKSDIYCALQRPTHRLGIQIERHIIML